MFLKENAFDKFIAIFNADIKFAYLELAKEISFFVCLDDVRQYCLLQIALLTGAHRFLEEKEFIELLSHSDFKHATHMMRNSLLAYTHPHRLHELCRMLEHGEMPKWES